MPAIAEMRERSFATLGTAYKENVADPWLELFKLCRAHWKKALFVILLEFVIHENAVHHMAEVFKTSHGILDALPKIANTFTGNGD